MNKTAKSPRLPREDTANNLPAAACNEAVRPHKLLLPLGGAPSLSRLPGWESPGLVVEVSNYGLREARREVDVRRLTAKLGPEVGHIGGVAAVVAGAIAHPVEVVLQAAEALGDLAQHGDADQLAVDGDQVDPHPNLGGDA